MENAVLIAVVDDEKAIRDVLEAALEDAGYSVALAGSGEEAIALLDKRTEPRGLITDVRLGRGKSKLSGWDVARRARELNPAIAVVYMTGDSSADWTAQGVPKSVMVEKPFAISQIVTAVAQLLNESG